MVIKNVGHDVHIGRQSPQIVNATIKISKDSQLKSLLMYKMKYQKIDAPPRLLSRGLTGARFIKNLLWIFECHRNVGALRDLDDLRVDHILKNVISGKHGRHDITRFEKEVIAR